jgi:hypothetical protein
MRCLIITEKEKDYLMIKNKTLVKNMEYVKWDKIPPLKGPNSQGLNVPVKQSTTIKNSENINGGYGQSVTKRNNRD